MLVKWIDLVMEQLRAIVRRRTKEAVKEAVEEGIKDALSELELSIDLEATIVQRTSVKVIEQLPALAEVPRLEHPTKRKRGRPRKHMNYDNSHTQGS